MDSSSCSARIKLDDPLLSSLGSISSSRLRMICKEASIMSAPSCYYGDVSPGAVPFMWESIPGTPKHPSLLFGPDSDPPPLTPPPSFYQNPPIIRYKPVVARSRFNPLSYMLRGIRLRSGSVFFSSPSRKPHSNKSDSASACTSSVCFSPSCSSSLSPNWSTTTAATTTSDGGRGPVSNGGDDGAGGGWRSSSLKYSSRFCFVLGRNNSWRRRNGHRLIES